MKILLLASAAVLSLGVGSAFAANTALSGPAEPAASTPVPDQEPGTYAYYTPQGLMPRTKAPALPQPGPTPWSALEAYASDAAGGG
jgi:hypothetical protein